MTAFSITPNGMPTTGAISAENSSAYYVAASMVVNATNAIQSLVTKYSSQEVGNTSKSPNDTPTTPGNNSGKSRT